MASNLILRVASEFDPKGFNQLKQNLEDVKQKTQQTATASASMGESFRALTQIIGGAVLTLPLTGFIKEAITSEEVTSRFRMQVESLGKSFTGINLEAIIKQTRDLAGITSTELVKALSSGLVYFKDTDKELQYLNTAIGMTKVRGVDLATAFQQLGYIMLGSTRVARLYGISIHSEIHDPSQRAAVILDEMRKKMEPLAKQTGTTAEALKIMGANIKDIGEKIGGALIAPIGEVAKAFNGLSDTMKEFIVVSGLSITTISGLVTAGVGILSLITKLKASGGLVAALGFIGGGAGALMSAGLLAAISLFIVSLMKLKEAQDAVSRGAKEYSDFASRAMVARATDANTSITMEEKFADKLKDTAEIRQQLAFQEAKYHQLGNTALEERAKKEKDQVQQIYNGMKKEVDERTKMNITTLAQEEKFQLKMREIANASMKEGLDKDLEALRTKAYQEREAMIKTYADTLEIRKALTAKEAAEEAQIRQKYIEKELEYALMSGEEQKKFDEDYKAAQRDLSNKNLDTIKNISDEEKKFLQDSKGAQKALKEWTEDQAKVQAKASQDSREAQILMKTYAIQREIDRAKEVLGNENVVASLEEKLKLAKQVAEQEQVGIKGLTSFTETAKVEEKKVAQINLNSQVNVSITPSLSELSGVVGKKVQDEVSKQLEDNKRKWLPTY